MTFEEKIDRLTERHEALAQTVELMGHRINDLANELRTNINGLITAINKDAENIRMLANIATSHEHRIERLEKNE